MGGACAGPAYIRCGLCGAVSYCSPFHQKLHWTEHKEECKRMEKQMKHTSFLHDFPFLFTRESTEQVEMGEVSYCSFLERRELHQIGLWKSECGCGEPILYLDASWIHGSWNLKSEMCPCTDPESPLATVLTNWADYYSWRCLPLDSPVALLLHWPLTMYYAFQLLATRLQNILPSPGQELRIHYLGPDKELHQLPVFAELCTLFPGVQLQIDFVGPSVPDFRDGEHAELTGYAKCLNDSCQCKVSRCMEDHMYDTTSVQCKNQPSTMALRFWKGLYHERFEDIKKVSPPHFIFAPNAGIAAYHSWLLTIKLISELHVPAVFTDYCEEAAFLAIRCISSIHEDPLALPLQINPFRQPIIIENAVLDIPTYSNSFLFGTC
ncbi:hypothetical protein SUGI_0605830 [Cryptomeria japonica]|nr:hypothetical protein SUGI_0605830 [Cryptomeria japonica]